MTELVQIFYQNQIQESEVTIQNQLQSKGWMYNQV
jgi:hypothetical protein